MVKLTHLILIAFGLSGMAALIYEVVWTRLLVLVFGSTTYAISTMLAAFMAGLALGSFLIAKYMHRITDPLKTFAYLEFGIGIYGILFISLLGLLQSPFSFVYQSVGHYFFLFSIAQFILIFVIMLIPTTLMGATFPIVSRIFVRDMENVGEDVGYVYSANSIGAVIGPIIAGFILIPAIGLTSTNFFAAILNIIVAIVIYNIGKFRKASALFVLPLVLVFLLFPQPVYSNIHLLSAATPEELGNFFENSEVLSYAEGAYSTVAVVKYANSTTLLIDGRADASTGITDMKTQLMLGYIPLFLHQKASSVLNIGLGAGFTLKAINNFDNVKSIDALEIEQKVIDASRQYFSEYTNNALDDKRVNVINADARTYLALTDKKYDVIISEPSHPAILGSSQLFTKEFFEIAKNHLNEHGIFAQWIPLYYITPEDFTVILNTYSSVFPHTEVWMPHSADVIILGSVDPEQADLGIFNETLHSDKINEDMSSLGIETPQNFLTLLMLDQNKVKQLTESVQLMNTDDNAFIEFRAPQRMLSEQKEDTTRFIMEQSGRLVKNATQD